MGWQSAMRYLPFVQDAVRELGYIKPEFDRPIAAVMEANEGQHPRAISLAYRKIGDQLTADEKRANGLRSNTFFSRESFESLTEKGICRIKEAHMLTMLHAVFAYFRRRAIDDAAKNGFHQFTVFGAFKDCPGCTKLNGSIVGANQAAMLPPDGCAREVCALSIFPYKNFLEGIC
jgi:hypothetical protein